MFFEKKSDNFGDKNKECRTAIFPRGPEDWISMPTGQTKIKQNKEIEYLKKSYGYVLSDSFLYVE